MADYDAILQAAGGFSYYQIFVYFWSLFTLFSVAGQSGFLVFAKIPPCLNTILSNLSSNASDNSCNRTFDYVTLPDQLSLSKADMYLMTRLVTVQMFGQLFGPPIAGYLSDRFGRRKSFGVFACLLGASSGVEVFCSSWLPFMVTRFFVGLGITGTATIQFVTASELFTAKSRTYMAVGGWPVGYIYGALVAMSTRHWRTHEIGLVVPIPVVLIMTYFLVESPKWLMSIGRSEEAIAGLKTIARWNRVNKAKIGELEELLEQYAAEQTKRIGTPPFWQLFYSKKATFTTLTLFYAWASTCFVFYLMFYGIGSLSGNPALNTIYIMLIRSILSLLIPIADRSIKKAGRKMILSFGICTMMLAITAIIIIYFTGNGRSGVGADVIRVASISALGLSTILWIMTQFLTTESFPTSLRNLGYGICQAVSRVGGISGPIAFELRAKYPPVPYIICLCLMAANMVAVWIFVPETKGKPLPELPPALQKKNEKKAKNGTI